METDPHEVLREVLSIFGVRVPAKPHYKRVRIKCVKCVKCGRNRKRGEKWSVVCDQCSSTH